MLLELNIVIIIWIARPTNGRPILTYAVVTPATETVTVGVATNGDEGVGVGYVFCLDIIYSLYWRGVLTISIVVQWKFRSVETQPFGPDTLSSSAPSMSPQPTQNVISKSYSLATSATEMPDVRPNATLDSILPLPTPSVEEQVPMDTFIVDGTYSLTSSFILSTTFILFCIYRCDNKPPSAGDDSDANHGSPESNGGLLYYAFLDVYDFR